MPRRLDPCPDPPRGGREEERQAWGSISAGGRSSLSKHSPILLHLSLAPTCWRTLGPRDGARLPLLLPGCEQEPCSHRGNRPVPCHQQSPREGLPPEGWPLTTRVLPVSPTQCIGAVLRLARLCCKPLVPQHQTTMAHCREPSMRGPSLRCSAPSCTNALLKRLVAQSTEDCKGTYQLALTKAEA